MYITWLGHSSFLFKDSKGRTLLTDPFDESIGYNVFQGKVDVVTISHHHFDHDYTKNLDKNTETLDKVGNFILHDIPIHGFPSYHDDFEGAKRGENIIFVFEMDGYRICHLGDLGHLLSSEEIASLGKIDVLLTPIGGNFTLDGKQAAELAATINSHIIIPMHYKTPSLSFEIEGLEKFLNYMKNGEKVGSSSLVLNGTLEGYNTVKILNYI